MVWSKNLFMQLASFASVVCLSFASSVFAGSSAGSASQNEIMQVERYSTVSTEASAAQINPLLSVSSFRFPQSVVSVGDAVNAVLLYSGYALESNDRLPLALVTVLSKPLPMVDRTLGPLTSEEALLVLVGKSLFSLNQDPINRTVNFHYLGKLSSPTAKVKT